MKRKVIIALSLFVTVYCTAREGSGSDNHKPEFSELYSTIAALDSIFWKAYNDCDLETQSRLYSENIEFYHDQAGLINSKQMILDATRENICGNIRRDLVKGTLEVYPLPGYGAVEMGMHTFQDITNPGGEPSQPGKFIVVWQQKGSDWTITRVISIH